MYYKCIGNYFGQLRVNYGHHEVDFGQFGQHAPDLQQLDKWAQVADNVNCPSTWHPQYYSQPFGNHLKLLHVIVIHGMVIMGYILIYKILPNIVIHFRVIILIFGA